MQFLRQVFVTRSGMQRYCSEACQAEAKRARVMQKNNLLQSRPTLDGDTASGVSHLFQSSHPHGCSRQYIYKLVAIGKLKASRISNRMAFIRRADIEQMLEGNPYHRILPGNTSTPRNHLHLPYLPKEKKGKGKRRSVGLLFGRGGDVPF